MAKQLMPQAELEANVTDVRLGDDEALQLSLFAQLKRKPSLDKYPGALMLRRFRKGEVICRQGEAGWTAFYVLTSEDVLTLPEAQGKKGAAGDPALLKARMEQLKTVGRDDERRRRIRAREPSRLLRRRVQSPDQPAGDVADRFDDRLRRAALRRRLHRCRGAGGDDDPSERRYLVRRADLPSQRQRGADHDT